MRAKLFLFAILATAGLCPAQSSKPLKLVTWYGFGALPLPESPDWKLQSIKLYDKGERPAATYKNEKTSVVVSFLLYNNYPDTPTAEGCRNDAIAGMKKQAGSLLSQEQSGELPDGHGGKFATASHRYKIQDKAYNQDKFLFAGSPKVCAEIHVSTAIHDGTETARLQQALDLFHPDLTYLPNSYDRFMVASLLYDAAPMDAAPYYKASIDDMPAGDPVFVTPRRIATDNLVMALGMSGDLKDSRAVATHAIEADPDYPMNYFNLACADAEEGKASQARIHLEQAFARKANTLKGETLPDPTHDDSILKLKSDPAFWAFAVSLKP